MYNYYNYREPCVLNAKFPYFKNSDFKGGGEGRGGGGASSQSRITEPSHVDTISL
jgi:hypothetical protein